MLRHWDGRAFGDVLATYGLAGVDEAPFPNDGWSGARLTRLVRPDDGAAFIVKRSSWALDWIARSTRDHALREGFVAATPMPLPHPLVAPYLGAGAEGTTLGLVMPDLSGRLLEWELGAAPLDTATLDRCLAAIAGLHAAPWPVADLADSAHAWPAAPPAERLVLLGPSSATRLAASGPGAAEAAGARFRAGWAAFRRRAPASAWDLVASLDGDPHPLVQVLGRLPAVGLHGDLKLGNLAPLPDGRVAAIDWQLTMLAPVAVELGWFLVVNSGVLPESAEATLARYRSAVDAVAGRASAPSPAYDPARIYPADALAAVFGVAPGARARTADEVLGDWPLQLDVTWIVGLLLRGWRKGFDAEAGTTLGSGIPATDDLAWWCDRAVDAAKRRL
ncbi:MAG TPA: hypothetical protein VEG29_08585 [Candidatus Binatia bacterium]|nr:hypothetical protein [Candidatus Binatia bacterium]